MRVDDANAIFWQEPYLSIRGLGYYRVAVRRRETAPDSVRVVQHRGAHRPFRISDPFLQLGPGDAYQAASRVQPEEMVVVLQHPVNDVAWQSVRARKPEGMAAPDKNQAIAGCRPNRPVIIELEPAYLAFAEALLSSIRQANRIILVVRDPALAKTKP